MNTVLVGIHFPVVRMSYDAFVPRDVPIKDLICIMVNGIVELSNGKYTPSGLEMLFLREPQILMRPERALQDYDVKDGMQLYLL